MSRCLYLFAALMILAAGCQESNRMASVANPMSSAEYQSRPEMTESLFKDDQQALSNETIATILGSRIVIPDRCRVVVVRYGELGTHPWWTPELAQLDQEAVNTLLNQLRSCNRVSQANVLPSMLAPRVQSVPQLRQCAARCQADLILLYRPRGHSYQKERVLVSDQVKAYCQVEAVLLDVRTGVIPFTSTSVKDFTAKKSGKDFDFAETVRAAEIQAQAEALKEVADQTTQFLTTTPMPTISESTNAGES